jgi:hypothetical protein
MNKCLASGLAYRANGLIEHVILNYDQAIKTDPSDADVFTNAVSPRQKKERLTTSRRRRALPIMARMNKCLARKNKYLDGDRAY